MFDLELKNPDELVIRCKDKVVAVNIAQSTVNADLKVGVLAGAGEYEIGDVALTGIALKDGGIMYRAQIGNIKIGLVGSTAQMEDLDNLGPIDILGTSNSKFVSVVEPKILIPMGNMDFAEVKAPVKVEKRIKIKNSSSLPTTLEIWKID